MWSPKTPLKLPGKKPKMKNYIDNLYNFNQDDVNDENDTDVLFSVQDFPSNSRAT